MNWMRLPFCLRPWTGFELDDTRSDWAHVRPCCWSLGHLGDANTTKWADVWNGRGFVEFRQRMLEGEIDGLCSPYCPKRMAPSSEWKLYLATLLRRPRRNRLLNIAEILRGATVLHSRPIYAKVSPSAACNLRCVMCYQSHETWLHLEQPAIEDLLEMIAGCEVLQVQGGEILASSQGLDFLARVLALPRPPTLGVITNGTFPITRGWDLLQQAPLRWVTVSLDAGRRETYERIRFGGDWDTVLRNIHRLCELMRERERRFKVYLSCTVMAANYREIPELLSIACQLGADVVINPLTPDPATAGLDALNEPALRTDLLRVLAETLEYAGQKRMYMARSTLRGMQRLIVAG